MPQDPGHQPGFLTRLQRRGVPRVAIGYAVIAWLLLQIGDVVLDPLDAPAWVMRALIFVLIAGFPVSLLLAWFLELGPAGISVDQLPEGAQRPRVSGLRRYADLVIIVFLIGIIAVLLARQEGWLQPEPETPILAVLPFSEIGKKEIGYFGAGLADTLSGKLGQLQQLVVLASSSTHQFADPDLNLADVGNKLGATSILLGSVQRAGGLLRVNARLVDPRSGQQLWTQSYDRDATDLFAVQDDIAQAVTRSLTLVLTPEQSQRLAQEPTNSLSAYEAYLRALDDLASRDHDRLTSALRYLRDAIALDPDYALAHATLPQALFLASNFRSWDTVWAEVRGEAQQSAERALALDPHLGEAWFGKAMVIIGDIEFKLVEDWSRDDLIALLEKALSLSPNNSAIMKQLANYRDDPIGITELMMEAARIDPRSGIIRINIAEHYDRQGEHELADQWLFEAVKTSDPYFALGYKYLASMGRYLDWDLARSARWGRAYHRRYPEDWAALAEYSRTLLDMGAWEEMERVLGSVQAMEQPDEALVFTAQLMQIRLLRAKGDYQQAARISEQFVRENLLSHVSWPDLAMIPSTWLPVFEAMALADIEDGKAMVALDRYLEGYADPSAAPMGNYLSDSLRAPVMIGALYRLTGDETKAQEQFRTVLSRLDAEQENTDPRAGGEQFTRFTALAFLGEEDAAIAALEASIASGWVPQWWGLKDATSFDANYAAVVADPRFEKLYEEIIRRITAMRESFESDPDLSPDVLQQAGLETSSN